TLFLLRLELLLSSQAVGAEFVLAFEPSLTFGKKIVSDGVNFRIGEFLLAGSLERFLVIVAQPIEVRHARGGTELARRPDPIPHPSFIRFFAEAAQARAYLAKGAGRIKRIGRGLELFLRPEIIDGGRWLQAQVRTDPA